MKKIIHINSLNNLTKKGEHLSDEIKKKISIAKKGTKPSPQTIAASVAARKGVPLREDVKLRISNTLKGKSVHPNSLLALEKTWGHKLSEETKQKISLNNKSGTLEVKEKNRQSHLGRSHSKETKNKARINTRKLWQNTDYRNKIYMPILFGIRKNPTQSSIDKRVATRTRNGTWNKKGCITPEGIERLRQARLQQTFPPKDSKPEKMVQIALALEGIQYEKHKAIYGQPDIFIEPNLCIFIDGCYFHGCPICCAKHLEDPIPSANLIRDAKVNLELNRQGYQVVRIFQHDINNDVGQVAKNIIKLIKSILYRVR